MLLTMLLLAADPIADAKRHITDTARISELVEFRNVRMVGDLVCGEANVPWAKRMSGFLPFAWKGPRLYYKLSPDGWFGPVNGTFEHAQVLKAAIKSARAGDDLVEAEAKRRKLRALNEAAEAFVQPCR